MSLAIDSTQTSDLHSLLIKRNGSEINDTYSILNVSIHHGLNTISVAEISILSNLIGDLDSNQTDEFNPGDQIEILAAYSDINPVSIFDGVIVSLTLHFNNHSNVIKIVCKHQAVRMTYGIRDRCFTNFRDDEAIKMILDEYGFTSEIESTNESKAIIRQSHLSDWDFIIARCSMHGFLIQTQGATNIFIGNPTLSASSTLKLTLGDNIISFQGSVNAENQPGNIQWRAWDDANQQVISAMSHEPTLNKQGNISPANLSSSLSQSSQQFYTSTPQTESTLQNIADSELLLKRLQSISGKVSCQGNSHVKPGDLIKLDGVGSRLSGDAFVSELAHTFNDGVWTSTIHFGLPQKKQRNDCSSTSAASTGLQLAKVHSIGFDPQNKQRILLEIPTSSGQTDLVWARMSHANASNQTGSFFIPEIGDEVVIGYLENEASYPVILGSLYNGQQQSPYPFLDTNPIKAFVSRNKLKMEFDDENKKISLSTPNNNQIILNEKDGSIEIMDQHSQLIKLNNDGISMRSNGDITLKANGKIKLEAMDTMTMDSKADITLNGTNLHANAQINLKLQGTTTTELTSSGITEIKGSMILIN